ncbi:hypothetical protein VNO77_19456 [Canavalia gladiata]|uniref:Uncharacterized protein n=1 Tax=Canavalia gladiata TaxID=3824 RepID=A0AAN9QKH1_CANGL
MHFIQALISSLSVAYRSDEFLIAFPSDYACLIRSYLYRHDRTVLGICTRLLLPNISSLLDSTCSSIRCCTGESWITYKSRANWPELGRTRMSFNQELESLCMVENQDGFWELWQGIISLFPYRCFSIATLAGNSEQMLRNDLIAAENAIGLYFICTNCNHLIGFTVAVNPTTAPGNPEFNLGSIRA